MIVQSNTQKDLSANISEVVEMAWCDKTSFDDIQAITGFNEAAVIVLMRQHLKPSSFRLWRKRVSGRTAKHSKLSARHHGKASQHK